MQDKPDWPQPVDGTVTPRFAGPVTFMRLPLLPDATGLDIALLGVPFDGGTTNRPGARHGPREIRNMSAMLRRVHPVTRFEPYRHCRVADVGDTATNPMDLMASLGMIEERVAELRAAGAWTLAVRAGLLALAGWLRAEASALQVLAHAPGKILAFLDAVILGQRLGKLRRIGDIDFRRHRRRG